MKFSLYSEMQSWGGKSWAQVYDEGLEQVVNANPCGQKTQALSSYG